jgi:hypothetical protein
MAAYLAFDRLLGRVVDPTPQCTLGLALVAKGKRPPVYDALTVALCFSNARTFDAAEAQLALSSMADFDRPRLDAVIPALAPSGKLRPVIFTDVGLATVDGTVDTDDWVALVMLCDIVLLGSPAFDHLTVVLSWRKKGAEGKSDRTTPEDVSAMMEARLKLVRRLDSTTFVVGATTVRVFQQFAQTTVVPAGRLLSVDEMLVESAGVSELRQRNAVMLAYLRVVHCAEGQDTVVLGCGPIDVVTAETLRASFGWTVSYSDLHGVNSGSVFDAQHSYRGACVFYSFGRCFDISTRVSRGTTISDDILDRVCDARMLAAVAENAAKVAGTPMLLAPSPPSQRAEQKAILAWRIAVSNVETMFPHFWDALAAAGDDVEISVFGAAVAGVALQEREIAAYSATFGLALVANALLAFGKPLDVESAISSLSAGRTRVSEIVEYGDLPQPVAAFAASLMPRATVRTAHDLFVIAALSMSARLSYVVSTAREFGVRELSVVATPPTLESGGISIRQPVVYSTAIVASHEGGRECTDAPMRALSSVA